MITFLYICCAIFAIFVYLVALPAINIQSLGFWYYLLFAISPFIVVTIIKLSAKNHKLNIFANKTTKMLAMVEIALVAVVALGTIIGTPLFGGINSYKNRITIPSSSSFDEIEPFNSTQVQIIDKNISMSLADRVFGEMGADVVSQFDLSSNFASVVVNGVMYRLTPVEYGGFLKWLSTKSTGTPGFISVNVSDGQAEFHKLQEGLKYTENACFTNSLGLHLRLQYPSFVFGNTKFEVDDNWHPYWVSQVLSYSFIGKTKDVKGVVVTDPITGENNYYDVKDVPSWVDNVYDAVLISEQYNDYGCYINGLFNFSDRGVTAVTDDYAYLQKDGHLWMYTGVTSVGQDESNVGFIYVDLQDKDVVYIVSAGAEEYSARASAEGEVQEKGYIAVFPTLVNIDGDPVYFMGLKDNAGLIKAYGFVDYKNYQKVGVGSTIQEALKSFSGKDIIIDIKEEKDIVVKDIKSAVVDGYTIYYIQTTENECYNCSIVVSEKLPFIKVNDQIHIGLDGNKIVKID